MEKKLSFSFIFTFNYLKTFYSSLSKLLSISTIFTFITFNTRVIVFIFIRNKYKYKY